MAYKLILLNYLSHLNTPSNIEAPFSKRDTPYNRPITRNTTMSRLIPLFILLVFFACSEQNSKQEPPTYTTQTAQMVSHVSSGTQAATDPIIVRFVSPVISSNQVGQTLQKKVFSFTPAIDGLASWQDTRTLIFQPNAPLLFRTTYRGQLDMAALIPDQPNRQPLDIQIDIAGRELVAIEADYHLPDPNTPNTLVFQGQISFNAPTQLSDVINAAKFQIDKRSPSLVWEIQPNKKTFTFTSAPLTRTNTEQTGTFTINNNILDLSQPYQNTWTLLPLSELGIASIKHESNTDTPTLNITFSDELDVNQDITGLITVEPAQNLQLKTLGKTVTVLGNFEHGQTYTLTTHQGIRSRWGVPLAQSQSEVIAFEDIKPRMRFSQDGVFLPTSGERSVRFQTVNLSRVHLTVQKVFESNLGQFLQDQSLNGNRDRRDRVNSYILRRVGVEVADTTLDIGSERNIWRQNELDLAKLISADQKGLFIVELRFEQQDMLYGDPSEAATARQQRRRYRGSDYRNHPHSPGYVYSHGRITKPIIVSDIGLTYYKAFDRHIVYATHLQNAQPLPGVTITLRTYQNQIIAQKTTDQNGQANFSKTDSDVFFVEAEHNNLRSVIKPNDMAWNLSTFDTGGKESDIHGTHAFFYTERGVYRPGDAINLSAIVRNHTGTFPDQHPIELKLINPLGQTLHTETHREGTDGFYTFALSTALDAPTGNWRAQIKVGSRTFEHPLKIETVVPFRLKVKLTPEKTRLAFTDKILKTDLSSTYLFGNPASNLQANVTINIRTASLSFSKLKGFSFTNKAIKFNPISTQIFNNQLNTNGKASITWHLPPLNEAPSALNATLTARVLEKGGRPNTTIQTIPIDPFPIYAGLKIPDFDYGYARVGTPVEIPIVAITPQGTLNPGRNLTCRVYRNNAHWWWEYDARDQFRLRFKHDRSTTRVLETTLISQDRSIPFTFTPEERGEYLIEIEDTDGHIASQFMQAYHWGQVPSGGDDAGALVLKTDQDTYAPGETAHITFPVPDSAAVLATLSRGGRILKSQWHTANTQNMATIPIPITSDMAPNVYVSVSVLQPHSQTLNDRPMRMYGVVPILVTDPNTKLNFTLTAPNELKPNETFDIHIQTTDQQPAQFTLAVVDEGLLDLTRFTTPDPHKAFFSKLRLSLGIFDLFAQVMGVNTGDIFKTFAIGGDVMGAYRKDQLDTEQKRRFKAVSMFEGPIATDEQGKATVSFTMPDYVGSVRLMAVAARGNAYGHAEKTVPVKTDLMILPTLPRVLGPGDSIAIPVTVFAMKDSLGPVKVTLSTEGFISPQGSTSKTVTFQTSGEKDVTFSAVAQNAIGLARVILTATSNALTTTQITNLDVRPSSPRITTTTTQEITPNQTLTIPIPDQGIPGSNRAKLTLHTRPNFSFSNRLLGLVRYPYGCIEQTVSAAFPQLYLKDILSATDKPAQVERDIDEHINAAIYRLRKFKLPSGGFSYWPGRSDPSVWGTLYAGHFLIEARQLGYHVPNDLLNGWLNHQKSRALTTRDNLMSRVYRVYLLARAQQTALGPMNLLKENNLTDMSTVEKWLLASAYQHAGATQTANDVLSGIGTSTDNEPTANNTYGSPLRDRALILTTLIDLERWQLADPIAEEVAQAMTTDIWYSTQTTGFALLALGKYLRALEGANNQPLHVLGTLTLPNDEILNIDTNKPFYTVGLENGFGQNLTLHLDAQTTITRAFATLEWSGIPLKSDLPAQSKNLHLTVSYHDTDGMAISPNTLKQGTSFWAHLKVQNASAAPIEEVALVHLLPAGWEIDNTRLSGESLPPWLTRLNLGNEEYVDMRDDRIMWFFDLPRPRTSMNFAVKLNAVTVGNFTLPPVIAEGMYNNAYKAIVPSKTVTVK